MDTSVQPAFMARFDEPTFCPTGIASHTQQYQYPNVTSLTLESPKDFASNGAPCEVSDVECEGGTKTSTIKDPEVKSARDNSVSTDAVPSAAPASIITDRHSRPESQNTSEEEEGRRVRFALPDPIHEEDIVQELWDALVISSQGEGQLLTTPWHQNPGLHYVLDAVDTRLNWYANHGSLDQTQSMRNLIARLSSLRAPVIDHEGLAVDDPRRFYDFSDFTDRWNFSRLGYKWSPFRARGSNCLLPKTRRPEVRRDETQENSGDMQGLRWDLVNTPRDDALEARKQMHRSPHSTHSSKQDGREDLLNFSCEFHYRFKAYLRKHRAHISHYQLRNVLATSGRNDIFYSTGNKVMQTSLSCPSIKNTVMDLSKPFNSAYDFRITCLSASPCSTIAGYRSDNLLFAGGFSGEYAMLDLNSESCSKPTEGFVTHDYNGLVTHVHSYSDRHSGSLRAVFCSNDRKMRILDAKQERFVNTFVYESAINCSAASPDGRLRVLVGDSHETLITDAEKGHALVTLKSHSNYGFACSWSADGRYVATGAQDGRVVIWDTRSWSMPLKTLECVMSPARSLNFTANGALVVAEEDDVVSIYSTRLWDMRQDVRLFGSIAGVSLLDGGAELVVANVDKTVGGLLTFQRTSQGLNDGTYGEQVCKTFGAGGTRRSRTSHSQRLCSDCFSDVFV